jgi:hypothetical protein
LVRDDPGSTFTSNPAALPTVSSSSIEFNGIRPELDDAVDFARAEKSTATRRAYRSDFKIFCAWCEAKRLRPLPASPEVVAAFLAFDAKNGTKPSTLERRLAALRYAHKVAGHQSPTIGEQEANVAAGGQHRSIALQPVEFGHLSDRLGEFADHEGVDGLIHYSAFPAVLGRLSTWPISKTFNRSYSCTAITTTTGRSRTWLPSPSAS